MPGLAPRRCTGFIGPNHLGLRDLELREFVTQAAELALHVGRGWQFERVAQPAHAPAHFAGAAHLAPAREQYVGHVRFLRVLTLGDPGARKAALAGMKAIHAAFRKRDAEAAATAMHKHLETAKHYLVLAIEQIEKEKAAEANPSPAAEADTGGRRGARS